MVGATEFQSTTPKGGGGGVRPEPIYDSDAQLGCWLGEVWDWRFGGDVSDFQLRSLGADDEVSEAEEAAATPSAAATLAAAAEDDDGGEPPQADQEEAAPAELSSSAAAQSVLVDEMTDEVVEAAEEGRSGNTAVAKHDGSGSNDDAAKGVQGRPGVAEPATSSKGVGDAPSNNNDSQSSGASSARSDGSSSSSSRVNEAPAAAEPVRQREPSAPASVSSKSSSKSKSSSSGGGGNKPPLRSLAGGETLTLLGYRNRLTGYEGERETEDVRSTVREQGQGLIVSSWLLFRPPVVWSRLLHACAGSPGRTSTVPPFHINVLPPLPPSPFPPFATITTTTAPTAPP